MLALLLLAAALGLNNLAGAIGIGVSGVSRAVRVRVAVVFGLFEAGMPLLGLVLGHGLSVGLGTAARWLGGALLVVVGVVALVRSWRDRGSWHDRDSPAPAPAPAPTAAPTAATSAAGAPAAGRAGFWRLAASGFALSVDNLAAGFALGSNHSGLAVAAIVFALVSVVLSLAGLELGAWIGSRLGAGAGGRAGLVSAVILIGVGAAIAAGAF